MTYNIYAVAHSQNRKTGDIAQTYTSANSCPVSCALRDGCYGKSGLTRFAWNRANRGEGKNVFDNAEDLRAWVIDNVSENALLRHNVAGDICKEDTDDIDSDLLNGLVHAFDSVTAYTYTHCAKTEANMNALIRANRLGFTVNSSCETVEECDFAIDHTVPAVLAVVDFESMPKETTKGRKIIACPAQIRDDITCKKCKLCARADRKTVIAFAAHGSCAKKAKEAIAKKVLSIKAI